MCIWEMSVVKLLGGSPRRIQSVLGHTQAAPSTEPPEQKPGPSPTTRTGEVRPGGHHTGSPPPGAQWPQSHPASQQSTGQFVDATFTPGTQVPPSYFTAGPTDVHTRHMLLMRAQSTGDAVAHSSTVGTRPPHAVAPRYPEQHRWLQTHFEPAPADVPAQVAWRPDATSEWRMNSGKLRTKQPAITYPVIAEHHSAAPEAPAYPVKHRYWRTVPERQTIKWTTCHPKRAYMLQYIHHYLAQGHKRKNNYMQNNAAAAEIIHQGKGVYATSKNQTGHHHTVGHCNTRGVYPGPTNQQPRAACPDRTTGTP